MPRDEMCPCKSERKCTRLELRFLVLCPATHRRPKVIDLDQQRQGMVIEVAAGDRRLAHSRWTVEQDQAGDPLILPHVRTLPHHCRSALPPSMLRAALRSG